MSMTLGRLRLEGAAGSPHHHGTEFRFSAKFRDRFRFSLHLLNTRVPDIWCSYIYMYEVIGAHNPPPPQKKKVFESIV
jgi:hypothetical protein